MNAATNQPDMDLLGKYLAGEAAPEEAMRINEWLADPKNRTEREKMLRLWAQLSGDAIPRTPSLQESWSDIQSALEISQKKIPQKKLSLRRIMTWSAAAAVIILLSLSALLFNKNNASTKQVINVASEDIVQSAGNTIVQAKLPDGSLVTLNSKSVLHHPASFKNNRVVSLRGESYFEVAHDSNKPFIVTIGDLSIQVMGTAFNVRPLENDATIEVQVQSGTVKMRSPKAELIVTKGQTGVYHTKTHELQLRKEIDLNSFSYATKSFTFTDLSMEQVCMYLEKSFNVTIELNASKLVGCRITAQFDNKPLDYILDVIGATLNTTYTKKGNHIYLDGEGCN